MCELYKNLPTILICFFLIEAEISLEKSGKMIPAPGIRQRRKKVFEF